MNRKLVNGLLLLSLASGGCGVFTSCKDTNEGFYNEVIKGQVNLEDRVDALEKYTGYVDGLENNLKSQIAANKVEIGNLTEEYKKLKEQLTTASGTTQDAINDINGKIEGVTSQISKLLETNAALEAGLKELQEAVDRLDAVLADYKPGITQEELDKALQAVQIDLEEKIEGLKNALEDAISGIEADLDGVKDDLSGVKDDLSGVKEELANTIAELNTAKEELAALKTDFDKDHEDLLRAVADIALNAAKIEVLENNYSELKADFDELKVDHETLKEDFGFLASDFGDLYAEINGKGGLKDDIRNLTAKLNGALDDIANNKADIDILKPLVEENKQSIEDLQKLTDKYFSNINEVLNLRVSDILLNQTWNPMFGSINLPIGLASTVAANYYGYADHTMNFPLSVDAAEYDVLHANSGINKIGAAAINNLLSNLKGDQEVITAGKHYMNDGENNLGQLYLSVNPTHIDTKNINFELVASNGEKAPIDVNVVETNEKLNFGISRSASNGFYRANLHVDAENAPAIGIRVEEDLKSAMKDALKDHTKSDLVQLAKVLAKQMENILPAYGVKATWKEPVVDSDPVTRTYISQYNVAATAFRPLGYEFMQGQGANKDLLPTVGSLKDAFDKAFSDIANKINIKIPFDNIGGLDFEGLNITINIDDISFAEDAPKIEINLGGIKVEGEKTESVNPDGSVNTVWGVIGEVPEGEKITLTYNPNVTPGAPGVEVGDGALNEFLDQMTDKINDMLNQMEGQINDDLITQVNDLIENKIKGQVNDMITNINDQLQGMGGKINDQIKDILTDIKNDLLGKLGRVDNLVDKYNKIANKINDMLKDPNHYLQVTMFYNAGNGDLGELSSNINYPTIFTKGSGNALTLYATSYTAELIAPSYKKYVAVSRAWKPDGTEATSFNEVNKANEIEFLNEVRPGNQQKFGLDTDKLEKDYKYEIIYSSLDYQGYTSTRTFYLVVK